MMAHTGIDYELIEETEGCCLKGPAQQVTLKSGGSQPSLFQFRLGFVVREMQECILSCLAVGAMLYH